MMNNMLHLPPIPTSILGLSNITIKDASMDDVGDFIIKVKSLDQVIKCKKCKSITSPHGYNRSIRLRHLPVFGHKTYIEISPARGICNNCDKHPTTTESSDWYNPGSSCTKAYEKHAILSLINSTISDVSTKEDLGYKAIEAIVDRYIESKVNWNDISEIGLLGIDEISLKKGYKDFITLITSRSESGTRIICLIRGRDKAEIKTFLASIPPSLRKTIIAVCSDMYDGFVNSAKEVFGSDIPVIVDRYHVSKLYRKCLVTARKAELKKLKKKLTKEEYKELKPAILLLSRRKECEFSDNEKAIVEPLFKLSPKLKKAYDFCLKLTSIYNKHSTAEEASNSIDSWTKDVENSKLTCFKTFIKTLKKYQPEICNYFLDRNTSGFVEGFNNKVKVLKRRCYGIFNLKHLFQRIFLDFSGYRFLNNMNEVKV
jgi:transposase